MCLLHKKCTTAILSGVLSSVVSAQTPDSLPCPTPASKSDCSGFEGALLNACTSNIGDSPGVVVITPTSGADISAACDNWLILGHSSNDESITTSATDILNLRNRQKLIGVSDPNQPAITFSDSSPADLIRILSPSYEVKNLRLEGRASGMPGSLLYTFSPSLAVIRQNTFDTTSITRVGIAIEDNRIAPSPLPTQTSAPTPACNSLLIRTNTFELSGNEYGISISCVHGESHHASIQGNYFSLAGRSEGIHIIEGGAEIKGNTFTQTGHPKNPDSTHPSPPLAISYSKAQPLDERGHGRPFHNTSILCNTFDGGSYGDLVPVSLSHFANSSEGHHNQVTIAHNTFTNVAYVVQAFNSHESISAQSYCNIWDNTDDSIDRCPRLMQEGEFIHFTDGVSCGTEPEDFSVNCYEERVAVCDSAGSLKPPLTPTLAVPWQTRSASPESIVQSSSAFLQISPESSDGLLLPLFTSMIAVPGQTRSASPETTIKSVSSFLQSSPKAVLNLCNHHSPQRSLFPDKPLQRCLKASCKVLLPFYRAAPKAVLNLCNHHSPQRSLFPDKPLQRCLKASCKVLLPFYRAAPKAVPDL